MSDKLPEEQNGWHSEEAEETVQKLSMQLKLLEEQLELLFCHLGLD